MRYLLRMSGEINIKSDRIRANFHRQLVKNLNEAFRAAGIECVMERGWTRFFVDVEDEQSDLARDVLSRVFGLSSFSPVDFICSTDLETLKTQIMAYKDRVANKTFAVRLKRVQVNIDNKGSVQLERELGSLLFSYAAGVNLKAPDLCINIEVRPEGAYFFSDKFEGAGGFPIGVGGEALCLFSGGFDSTVAAWYAMRRGIEVHFVLIDMGSQANQRSIINIVHFLVKHWGFGYLPKLYVVKAHHFAEQLLAMPRPSYAQVILKRLMYRLADAICHRERYQALISGEAAGQVSSQTLSNLVAIDHATNKLVLRPVIMMEKTEIMNIARRIGTFSMHEKIREYCSIVPKRPATATTIAQARRQEEHLDPNLLETALENTKTVEINDYDIDVDGLEHLICDDFSSEMLAIDCREQKDFEAWHYPNALRFDLMELQKNFKKLDKTKAYIVYCQYGVESTTIAEMMQDQGYEAYGLNGGVLGYRRRIKGQQQGQEHQELN
jgi:tRNA uracil 4-sulfurtransferase